MEGIPNNLEFSWNEVKRLYLAEIEDRITTPNSSTDFTSEDIDNISSDKKIEETREKKNLLIRICQDLRLNPDEIDEMLERVF